MEHSRAIRSEYCVKRTNRIIVKVPCNVGSSSLLSPWKMLRGEIKNLTETFAQMLISNSQRNGVRMAGVSLIFYIKRSKFTRNLKKCLKFYDTNSVNLLLRRFSHTRFVF